MLSVGARCIWRLRLAFLLSCLGRCVRSFQVRSPSDRIRWLDVGLGAVALVAVLCAGAYASAAPETINEVQFCVKHFFYHLRVVSAQ